jgi:thiol-disulfide isomerase/thioredoxin
MKKGVGLVLWSVLFALSVTGQTITGLRELRLTGSDGRVTTLGLAEDRPQVILVLAPDCPISQKYIPTIKALHQVFKDKVDFVGIFPGYFNKEEVSAFAEEYGLSFPWYIDREMSAVAALKATVTPEAFLLTPDMQCRYSGAIDNWFYELGKYRQTVTDAYLKDAIEAVLSGTPVKTTQTQAIGCIIEQSQRSTGHSHSH